MSGFASSGTCDVGAPQRTAARVARQAGSLYGQFVAPGDLCFDIGANMGARTAVLRALGARVVAVELQHGCVELLRDRFGTNVEVVEAAVGAASGTADLLVPAAHTPATLSPEWADAVRESGRFAEPGGATSSASTSSRWTS